MIDQHSDAHTPQLLAAGSLHSNIQRNLHWHGLQDGRMPPYPAEIVQEMLGRFGLDPLIFYVG